MEGKTFRVNYLELTTDECIVRGIMRTDDTVLEKEITFNITLLPSELRLTINDISTEIFKIVDRR